MNDRADLDWLAFRYVAGELDAADTRVFELQLQDDQDAREAVARACALAHCILVAERECPPDRRVVVAGGRRVPWQALAVAALGLAACLLLTLATRRLPRPEDSVQTVAAPRTESSDADQLAVIWSETRQPLDDPLWPPEQLDDESFEEPVALADLSAGDDWIAIAVFGLAEGVTNDQ